MYYLCFNCGKRVEHDAKMKVRCNHCGGKIIYKDRQKVVKIKAR